MITYQIIQLIRLFIRHYACIKMYNYNVLYKLHRKWYLLDYYRVRVRNRAYKEHGYGEMLKNGRDVCELSLPRSGIFPKGLGITH